MKNTFKIVILLFCTVNAFSQVGVGTAFPTTSSVLDINSSNKGVLIPRVTLTATNNLMPFTGSLTNGTMVFNTAPAGSGSTAVIPGVYIWQDDQWVFPATIGTSPNKAVKFTNKTTSTTDFNLNSTTSPISIDIFGNEIFNDDPSVYERLSDSSLKIKEEGLYLLSINLALKQVPQVRNSRVSNYIYFSLDGQLASAKLSVLVPQYDPNRVDIDGRFAFGSNSYVRATAGQILTLHSVRYKDGRNYDGTVKYDNVSASSVTIVKIR